MAEKIPYEVLLPIAYKLFRCIPEKVEQPAGSDGIHFSPQMKRELLARDFANFYRKLNQLLMEPGAPDSTYQNQP